MIGALLSRLEKPQATSFAEVHQDVSRSEIESELRSVLHDPEFLKNVNSAKFLKFIVDETLDGRGARLKAYTIATLALEREGSFDPQSNSIVRVQAMRLRELLDGYYSGSGSNDRVQILLRRGTYQPAFERRPEAEILDEEPPAGAVSGDKSTWPFSYLAVTLILGGLAAVAAGLVARDAWTGLGHPSTSYWPQTVAGLPEGRPSVVIETPETVGASPRTVRLSQRLFRSLEEGFGNFEYFALRSSDYQSRDDIGSGYVLRSQLEDSATGQADVALHLVYEPTGSLVWSRHYDDVDVDDRNSIGSLANSLIADLADPQRGAIFSDIRDRLQNAKAPLRGYACLVGALEFLRTRTREKRAVELNCVESEVAARPEHVGAVTLLATMLILSYLERAPESRGIADLERAVRLAGLVKDLAPQRAATLDVVFLGRFYGRQFDSAFLTARQVLAANPNGNLFAERIAAAYISRGKYSDGLALLRPMEATIPGPPVGSIPYLALAAHMRGDASATLGYAQRTSAESTPLGLLMRIVACHEHADQRCVDAAQTKLRTDYPGFAGDIPGALDRYAMTDSIKTTLLNDLTAAGYAPTALDRKVP